MAKHVKSQKTQLFTVIAGTVVRFICPKRISFGQDSFGKIDVTCLDADVKEYERGMRDPGEGAIGIDLDDENTSHDKLMEIAKSGDRLTWYAGSSHSADLPTYDATTGIDLPDTRSWWKFDGYLNDAAPNDIEVDTVIGYEFTLVRTSGVDYIKRTVTP